MESNVEQEGESPDRHSSPSLPRTLTRKASFLGDDGVEDIKDVREFEVPSPGAHSDEDAYQSERISVSSGFSKKQIDVTSGFIGSRRRHSISITVSNKRSAQFCLRLLRHPLTMNGMGLLTLFDAYLTCADIDVRADPGAQSLLWHAIASNTCLALYCLEYAMWIVVLHWKVLRDRMLLIDLCILVTGFAELILSSQLEEIAALTFLRLLRIARILRLLKVFRKMSYLKELRKLVNMTSTCFKTLMWSFIFCFVIMTIWAMLLVEFVHPLILELEAEHWPDCDEQCRTAASSVMHANLLLFKTVIAGDSWGRIAVPVIQAYPATGIIFVGSQLTLVFGVLQLVVAVVVDTFAEKRERDVLNRAEEMENDIEEDKRFLQKIFDRVDEDGSGELTLEELIDGANKDPEFQSRLRVMDIDQSDLTQLFAMIDVKGTGQVDPEEFIQPLSRWVHESKTANRFVKYNVMRTMHQNEELRQYAAQKFDILSSQIQRIATCLGVPLEAAMQPTRRVGCVQLDSGQAVKWAGGVFERDRLSCTRRDGFHVLSIVSLEFPGRGPDRASDATFV